MAKFEMPSLTDFKNKERSRDPGHPCEVIFNQSVGWLRFIGTFNTI